MAYGAIVPLVSLALSAAGTAASMKGQADAQAATEQAAARERRRQQGYQEEAQKIAQKSIADSGEEEATPKIDAAAQERAAQYNRITAPIAAQPATPVQRSVANPLPTANAIAAQNEINSAWNRILGNAQGRLGGYQDWGLEKNIAAQRAGQDLELIGHNARGSGNVLASELDDASHAGDATMAAGQILGSLGRVGGMYASVGGTNTMPRVDAWGNYIGDVNQNNQLLNTV